MKNRSITLEEFFKLILSEYGLLVAFSLTCITVLWRRLVVLEDKFATALENNTMVIAKLLERTERHDDSKTD